MGEKGNMTSGELASSLLQQSGDSLRSTVIDKSTDAAVESVRERLSNRQEEPGTSDSTTP